MKTTSADIILTSLKLFAQYGYEAVSTSMIAGELGITKGALYRHFENKQEIFDSIIATMHALDEKQATENHVSAGTYEQDGASYKKTQLIDLCEYVNEQFVFWTENEFVRDFRRMITIEQFKSPEMNKLYQDTIALGPVKYTEDLFHEMLLNGQLNQSAKRFGARNLAIQLFAPLELMLKLYDGGEESNTLKKSLRAITKDFEAKYMK